MDLLSILLIECMIVLCLDISFADQNPGTKSHSLTQQTHSALYTYFSNCFFIVMNIFMRFFSVSLPHVTVVLQICIWIFFFNIYFFCLIEEFTDSAFPDTYFFELEEKTSLECGLVFSPKEVSSTFYY